MNIDNDTIRLASGLIVNDELSIVLIRPRMPAAERTLFPSVVRVLWPTQPHTDISPQHWADTAVVGCQVFAEAATKLAQIRARVKYL